jgi:hypothetical protein
VEASESTTSWVPAFTIWPGKDLAERSAMRRILLVLLVATTPAYAEPTQATTSATPSTYDLGLRVGGYGFRREGDNKRTTAWTECRMDGFGVFGSRALTGPLFLEGALDMYSSTDFNAPGAENDLPVARTSGILSTAIGARVHIASRVRGFVQLGIGVELTRVSVPYGEQTVRDQLVMPEGFFGAGVDVRLFKRTHVGAQIRAHVMGNFEYDAAKLDTTWTMPTADEVFDPSADAAAQGQFYVRHDL